VDEMYFTTLSAELAIGFQTDPDVVLTSQPKTLPFFPDRENGLRIPVQTSVGPESVPETDGLYTLTRMVVEVAGR
jgi:hypothetical protein